MEYQVIRSRRKTMSIQIVQGRVIVRAPLWSKDRSIMRFVDSHTEWIEKSVRTSLEKARKMQDEVNAAGVISSDEIRRLADEARKVIPERVRFYAPLIGVNYGRITIRNQRSKWGSCSAAGNLNFNCLLMLSPPEVLDSVVIHELCHRLEMNHSERFYALLYKYCPDYDKCRRWLKNEGSLLMARAEKALSLLP